MGDNEIKHRSEEDALLEREIREGRKFTLEDAIGRMVGPGGMKGESPVSRLQQADFEILTWLRSHLSDGGGLGVVLHRDVKESELLLKNLDHPPLAVLALYCQRVLDSDYQLRELVRNADVEWGRMMDERPHFEREGSPPHPEDPYTIESVRHKLSEVLQQLAVDNG